MSPLTGIFFFFFFSPSRTLTPSQFSPTEQEVFMQLGENVSLDPTAAASVTRGHVSKHQSATGQSIAAFIEVSKV